MNEMKIIHMFLIIYNRNLFFFIRVEKCRYKLKILKYNVLVYIFCILFLMEHSKDYYSIFTFLILRLCIFNNVYYYFILFINVSSNYIPTSQFPSTRSYKMNTVILCF